MFRDVISLQSTAKFDELRRYTLRLVSSIPSVEILRRLAVENLDQLRAQLIEPLLQPAYLWWLQLLLDNLLDNNDCNGLEYASSAPITLSLRRLQVETTDDNAEVDTHVQVGRLLDLANDFSIELCKLKLRIILTAEYLDCASFGGPDLTSGARVSNTIARPFIRGIAAASNSRRRTCTELLMVLDKERAAQVFVSLPNRISKKKIFANWSVTPRFGAMSRSYFWIGAPFSARLG